MQTLCNQVGIDTSNASLGDKRRSRSILCRDISKGLEPIEIPVVNEVDSCPAPIDNFIYVTSHISGTISEVKLNPDYVTRCSCTDNCSDPRSCECAMITAGFAYDTRGNYSADKPGGVYECNMFCRCHSDLCSNRTVGRGIRLPLEVFRCPEPGKGWGLRCKVDIPIGTFVSDYIGEVLREAESEVRGLARGDEYLFGRKALRRTSSCFLKPFYV